MAKKSKAGKIVVPIIALLLVIAISIGAFLFARSRNKATVNVYPVSLLNEAEFYSYESQLSGVVSSDHIQEVRLKSDAKVKKVYVKKGDKVKKGEKLLKYDAEEEELDLQLQELQIKAKELNLEVLEKQLEELKKYGKIKTQGGYSGTIRNSRDEDDTDGSLKRFYGARKASAHSLYNSFVGLLSLDVKAEENTGEPQEATTQAEGSTQQEGGEEGGDQKEDGDDQAVGDNEKDSQGNYTLLSGISGEDAGSDTFGQIYCYFEMAEEGKVTGSALKAVDNLLNDKEAAYKYVVFQWVDKNGNIKDTQIITAGMKPNVDIQDDQEYGMGDIIGTLAYTPNSVKIYNKDGTVAVTSLKQGEKAGYAASLNDVMIDSQFVRWSVTGKKANATKMDGSTLKVGSGETASKVTVHAEMNGEKVSEDVTIKKKSSGSGGSGSSSSDDSDTSSDDQDISDEPLTGQELRDAIDDKEADIAQTKTEIKEAKIAYKEAKMKVEDSIVRAKIKGTVVLAYKKKDMPKDGSPVIIIKAAEGMYVKTYVNEMDLDSVKVGGILTCTSWETQQEYQAEITEISDYPISGSSVEGSGNPNSSLYPVVAYIKDAEGLTAGTTLDITYDSVSMGTADENAISIPKAYVRDEGSKSYVYVRGKKKKLEKRYVETGAVMYGQTITIISGITEDDYIAFPYGKEVKEGAKTKVSEDVNEIVY